MHLKAMAESLTILVLVFDEEDCIQPFVFLMNHFLDLSTLPSQILFVIDGSTDRSPEMTQMVCNQDAGHYSITLERNSDLSLALKAGIDHCDSTFIGDIDADLQTTPAEFLKLIEFIHKYDLVTGYRLGKKDAIVTDFLL